MVLRKLEVIGNTERIGKIGSKLDQDQQLQSLER